MTLGASHRIAIGKIGQPLRQVFTIMSCVVAAFFAAPGTGQCAPATIKLLPQQLSQIETKGMPAGMRSSLAKMPANSYHFGVAAVGKPATPETLKFEFSASTTVTNISSSPDFTIVPGGTCGVGHRYGKGSTCELRVQFTPQGAGPRSGKIVFETDIQPVRVAALGYYYTPVISFTPSTITTLPASISGGVGQILSAKNIAVDNGDNLLIADTGNNLIRYVDSSGKATTLTSSYPAPWGVTEDQFGEVYFSQPAANALHEIYDYGPVVQINGLGTGSCPASAPCTLNSHAVTNPGEMSMDPYNNMFFTEQSAGGAFSTVQPIAANLISLYNPFAYQTNPPSAAAMDASDNVYTLWSTSGNCRIVQQSLYNAENSKVAFVNIAGGRSCGFSGDGGRAGKAEIGNSIGQIAFDAAGNLYFTDSKNQRVRRIDAATGIIRTIAGTGAVGYTGDGGPATKATLSTPTGLAVDSLGQVYILTQTKSPPQQVVRVVGTTGDLAFGTVKHGTSTTLVLRVSNTGNSAATFSGHAFVGADKGDFQIDTTGTNCSLAAGAVLSVGQSCAITVIFKPQAVGARSATLRLLDNTVNDMNVVALTGRGK
jgi:hypothetical protein